MTASRVRLYSIVGLQEEDTYLIFDHKGHQARITGKIDVIMPQGELWIELTEAQAKVAKAAGMEVKK